MGRKETQIDQSEIDRALAKTQANIVPIINLKAAHRRKLGAALQILKAGQRAARRIRNQRRKAAAGITAHRPNTACAPCYHTSAVTFRAGFTAVNSARTAAR